MAQTMKCLTCEADIPKSTWKKQCYSCYKSNNQYKKKAKKYNPCEDCSGEDCQCCSYGNGY